MVITLGSMAKRIAKLEAKVKILENKECSCVCSLNSEIELPNVPEPLIDEDVYTTVNIGNSGGDEGNVSVGEDLIS